MKLKNILCGALAFAAAACGGGGQQPAGGGAGQEQSRITIGVAGPMTGDLRQFGESLKNGAAMAFDEINASGGLLGKQVDISVGDDQANSKEAMNVARNFVGDSRKPLAVLGHFNSGSSKPAGEIYNQAGIIMLTPASTNPAVTSPERPYVFRNLPNDAQNGDMLAQFIIADMGAKRIAIYFANNEYGKGLAEIVEKKAAALGVTVVDKANYDPAADEDFRPVLTKWKSARLDAIVLAGETPKAAQLIKQAREIGLDVPFAGGDGIASSDLWTIGRDAVLGTFVVSYFHPGNPDTAVQDFVKRFKDKYGREPDVWAAQAYDAARVLADAVKRAGTVDGAKVRDALAATDGWRGVTGPHRFKDGDAVGKRVIITRVEAGPDGPQFGFHKEVAPESGE
ncbi:MAG: ABC transporter substrate-binding protein [Candidatus Hydrogenedentota bacterium]